MSRLRLFSLLRSRLIIALPLLWLVTFLLVPMLFIGKISLSETALAQPPYRDWLEFDNNGARQWLLTFHNYARLAQDSLYLHALFGSLSLALFSTILCVLIGYPMAYAIARAPEQHRVMLLMLVVIPFWTSFLLRVYAWIAILKPNGLLNQLLLALGIIDEPLAILYTPAAAIIGMVYSYLPFFILPLYATLVRLDTQLLEAAADLGARPWRQFLTITLPLSVPGVIAGCLLVFIPAVGEFVIPDLLGGSETLMIGKTLWTEFFNNRDWPLASAVAVLLLLVLIVPIVLYQRQQEAVREAGR